MLMNNLDPDVAERPQDLVVYGGTGKAARDWPSYHALVRTLTTLGAGRDDAGPVGPPGRGVPHPRVGARGCCWPTPTWSATGPPGPSSAGSRRSGLTMYGQMTAGSWIYIGTQGILQGTYETFAAVAAKRFGGTLAGTLTLTAGCGGMGGAQPLAVTMNGGACLVIDVDPARLRRRVDNRYLDTVASSVDDAVDAGRPRPGRAAGALDRRGRQRGHLVPELLRRGRADRHRHRPDLGPRPAVLRAGGHRPGRRAGLRGEEAGGVHRPGPGLDGPHVEAMVGFLDAGAEVFDYGNSIRGEAQLGGYERAFAFPGFVPAYIRPLFCEGKGPFRWAALSGDPADIAATDRAILDLFPDNESLARWIRLAGERVAFQGLPARICWLGYGERDVAGLRFNEMVADGELSAPIVIGRDHLDCGSVASPVPGDRGDARRLRRDRRLAAAQRPGQHGQRRVLGLHPPRRRGRHRPVHPRRPGHRRRRHRAGRAEDRTGAAPTTPAWASSATSTPATSWPSRSPRTMACASRCGRAE